MRPCNVKCEAEGFFRFEVYKTNPDAAKQVEIDGKNMMIAYGPKVIDLPFSLKLDKFVMDDESTVEGRLERSCPKQSLDQSPGDHKVPHQ